MGVTTPISNLKIPELGSQIVIALVSTRRGVMYADFAAGAQVRGSGSNFLMLSGTTVQIAATLATIAYSNAVDGLDQLSVALLTTDRAIIPVTQMPLAVVSLTGHPEPTNSLVSYDSGTLTIEAQTLNGPNHVERTGRQSQCDDSHSHQHNSRRREPTICNQNATSSFAPRLAIAGHVELDGGTGLYGGGTAVSLARGATLSNKGTMTIDAGATRFGGGGILVNDGAIRLVGGPASAGTTEIATALAGSGTVTLTTGAALRLGTSVGAGETIRLGDGANALHLAQPGTFAGVIAGFSTGDTLVLDGVTATDALYTPAGDGGLLSIHDGALVVATIRFDAPEAGAAFQLTSDIAGTATISLAAITPGTKDVYRFSTLRTARSTTKASSFVPLTRRMPHRTPSMSIASSTLATERIS